MTATELFDLVGKVLPVLKTFANYTETPVDNHAVAFLEAVLESPALQTWLGSLFDAALSAPEADIGVLSLSADTAVVAELGQRKIDWAKVLEMLPTIIALFKAFAGK